MCCRRLVIVIGLTLLQIVSWNAGGVQALMCYICGQSNLQSPGECPTQFQYDCNSYARRFPRGTRVLCRTSRHAAPNNTFTMLKECIAETEHMNMFPNGKRLGCDTLFDNTGYEIKYCVCDRSLCNGKPLTEQFTVDGQRRLMTVTLGRGNSSQDGQEIIPKPPPLLEGSSNIPVNTNVNVNVTQPPPKPPAGADPNVESLTTGTARFGATSRSDLLNGWSTQSGDEGTTMHFREQPTAVAVRGLMCEVCSEGNLSGPDPECSAHETVECSVNGSSNVGAYCFTREASFATGMHSIQKLCVTTEALLAEYGKKVKMDGCSMAPDGAVTYCVCDTPHCNRPSIRVQMSRDPPFEYSEPGEPVQGGLIGPTKCYICGESGMQYPSDCPQQHEYECGLQYSAGTKVMCLTRLVRVADQFNIEKRCISEEEHLKNYPGNAVVGSGCSSAWQGYVEYCVCTDNMCNMHNLTTQQALAGYSSQAQRTLTTPFSNGDHAEAKEHPYLSSTVLPSTVTYNQRPTAPVTVAEPTSEPEGQPRSRPNSIDANSVHTGVPNRPVLPVKPQESASSESNSLVAEPTPRAESGDQNGNKYYHQTPANWENPDGNSGDGNDAKRLQNSMLINVLLVTLLTWLMGRLL